MKKLLLLALLVNHLIADEIGFLESIETNVIYLGIEGKRFPHFSHFNSQIVYLDSWGVVKKRKCSNVLWIKNDLGEYLEFDCNTNKRLPKDKRRQGNPLSFISLILFIATFYKILIP